MDKLSLTRDGRMCIDDYRSIHRAILVVLLEGQKSIYEMSKAIRAKFHELKYIQDKLIVAALMELVKNNLVRSTY